MWMDKAGDTVVVLCLTINDQEAHKILEEVEGQNDNNEKVPAGSRWTMSWLLVALIVSFKNCPLNLELAS